MAPPGLSAENLYIAIIDIKPLPPVTDWTLGDQRNYKFYYEKRGLSKTDDRVIIFETLKDANDYACYSLCNVYAPEHTDRWKFLEDWMNDPSNNVVYQDGCITMDKFPKEEKASRLAYPYKVTVKKYPYIPSMEKLVAELDSRRQDSLQSEPQAGDIPIARAPAHPTSRSIQVYKLITTEATNHNDQNEAGPSRDKYYIRRENALSAFAMIGVENDCNGLPIRRTELPAGTRVEEDIVQIEFFKEKRGAGDGAGTEKEYVNFEDWDGFFV